MKRGYGPFSELPAQAATGGHFTGLTGTPVPPGTFRSAFLPGVGYSAPATFQTTPCRKGRPRAKADPQRLSAVTYDVDLVEMKCTLPPAQPKEARRTNSSAFLFIGLIYANLSAAVVYLLGAHLGVVALAYILGGGVAAMVSSLIHAMLHRRAALVDAPQSPEHHSENPGPDHARDIAKAK